MGENRKSAVAARQSARARVAEKMAERKQREKAISERLESFFAADLLIVDAEKARDDAIAKAQETYDSAISRARDEKAGHVRTLKDLGLTDREIGDLIDQPVGAVRELLKLTRPVPAATADDSARTADTKAEASDSAAAGSAVEVSAQIAS